jgi:IS1 family transposase
VPNKNITIGVAMEEMRSFYHDKTHEIWLWWPIEKAQFSFWFGTREHKNLDKLVELLKPHT